MLTIKPTTSLHNLACFGKLRTSHLLPRSLNLLTKRKQSFEHYCFRLIMYYMNERGSVPHFWTPCHWPLWIAWLIFNLLTDLERWHFQPSLFVPTTQLLTNRTFCNQRTSLWKILDEILFIQTSRTWRVS